MLIRKRFLYFKILNTFEELDKFFYLMGKGFIIEVKNELYGQVLEDITFHALTISVHV